MWLLLASRLMEATGTAVPAAAPLATTQWQASDWAYLSEGNLHVVFGHVRGGTRSPQLRGRVLRLRKCSDKPHLPSVSESAAFAVGVMQRRLGRKYVDAGQLVALPPGFVSELAELMAVEPRRPAHRRNSTGLNTGCLEGLLLRDLTQPRALAFGWRTVDDSVLPSRRSSGAAGPAEGEPEAICVEIKAKCGLLPPGSSSCRFCQHQALKLSQGKVSTESGYCPLLLYGGARERDSLRLSDALVGLIGTPQNNFRVFGAGAALLYGESLPEPEPEPDPQGRDWRRVAWLGETCSTLYPNAGRQLGVTTPRMVAAAAVLALVRDLSALLIRERAVLQRLVSLQALDSLGVGALTARVEKAEKEGRELIAPDLGGLLGGFATATTAKDVSLMITLQQVSAEQSRRSLCDSASERSGDLLSAARSSGQTQQDAHAWPGDRVLGGGRDEPEWLDLAMDLAPPGGRKWAYTLTVCDLDPKPTTANLQKYAKLDAQISAAAAGSEVSGKVCAGKGLVRRATQVEQLWGDCAR